jgi:propanol-preferring alcohol dehydrogenase
MKAALLTSYGEPLSVQEIDTPRIGPNEVLVRVKACGVCYTDVKAWKGERESTLPFVLGHEISGVAAEVGKDVGTVVAGDPIAVYYYATDGTCDRCMTGVENLCKSIQLKFGGYAEYVSVPAPNCIMLQKNVSFEDAAFLTDAGLTSFHAIADKTNVKMGEVAMLQGMGGLALAGVQILKLIGSRVIAVSRTPAKLDFAKSLGADLTINSTTQDVVDEAMIFTGNAGVDYVFDYVGSPQTMSVDLRCLRPGGKLVPLGSTGQGFPPEMQGAITGHLLSLVGSRGGTRKNLRDLVKLLSEGRFRSIVTQSFELQAAGQALKYLAEGQIVGRAVVKP